eukprot:COSAG05_NODE_22908_length_261_cov_0.962963_1_plen_38_part_01
MYNVYHTDPPKGHVTCVPYYLLPLGTYYLGTYTPGMHY